MQLYQFKCVTLGCFFYPGSLMFDTQTSHTYVPVYSPRISLDMMTVKIGAELFTVSANDTATFFKLTKPRTTVVNLEKKRTTMMNNTGEITCSADFVFNISILTSITSNILNESICSHKCFFFCLLPSFPHTVETQPEQASQPLLMKRYF